MLKLNRSCRFNFVLNRKFLHNTHTAELIKMCGLQAKQIPNDRLTSSSRQVFFFTNRSPFRIVVWCYSFEVCKQIDSKIISMISFVCTITIDIFYMHLSNWGLLCVAKQKGVSKKQNFGILQMYPPFLDLWAW